MDYSVVSDRLEGALGLLPDPERADAERVLAIGRDVNARPRTEGVLNPSDSDGELRKELGRLVERLSRRSSKAVPFASYGRALLADSLGRIRDAQGALGDCETRLSLFGF